MSHKIRIDDSLCSRCGNCLQICPLNIFLQSEKQESPCIIHDELCVSCGQCVAICPQNAIIHKDLPLGSIHPIQEEKIPSGEQILELIRARRSLRAFINKTVEKELIEKIIEAAHFAPSSNNIQSTEFLVVQEKEILKKISELTLLHLKKTINKFRNPVLQKAFRLIARNKTKRIQNQIPELEVIVTAAKNNSDLILHNAPVLILFHADKHIVFSDVNANLALQNASLCCQAFGLGSFYAGYIVAVSRQDPHISKLCNLPSNHQIYGALAMGYPKFQFKNWIQRMSPHVEWLV